MRDSFDVVAESLPSASTASVGVGVRKRGTGRTLFTFSPNRIYKLFLPEEYEKVKVFFDQIPPRRAR